MNLADDLLLPGNDALEISEAEDQGYQGSPSFTANALDR